MELSQRHLAAELCVSEPTITRAMKMLRQAGRPLTELSAVKVLAIAELQQIGFSSSVAAEILVEAAAEVAYAHADPARTAWLIFVETETQSFRLATVSAAHLTALLSSLPLATVLPLHRVIGAAANRLERVIARSARRAAA